MSKVSSDYSVKLGGWVDVVNWYHLLTASCSLRNLSTLVAILSEQDERDREW